MNAYVSRDMADTYNPTAALFVRQKSIKRRQNESGAKRMSIILTEKNSMRGCGCHYYQEVDKRI